MVLRCNDVFKSVALLTTVVCSYFVLWQRLPLPDVKQLRNLRLNSSNVLVDWSNSTTRMNETLTPISIIVPSWSRIDTLPAVLAHLLSLDSLKHAESEILVEHVSSQSWEHREKIESEAKQILMTDESSARDDSSFEVGLSKLIHLNYIELNARWGCAVRHIAALEARNDVLVHLDDDLKPSDEAIQNMTRYVVEDPGFPNYSSSSDFPHFFGPTLRYCGPKGYHHEKDPEILAEPSKHQFILTNFAAMSSSLNRQFVSAFYENEFYQHAMSKFKGNGCDLIFNHFYVSQKRPHEDEEAKAESQDGRQSAVGGFYDKSLRPEEIEVTGYKGFYGGTTHKLVRNETCRCMFTNFTTDCLDKIPSGETPQ